MKTTQPKAKIVVTNGFYLASYGAVSESFDSRADADKWIASKHMDWLLKKYPDSGDRQMLQKCLDYLEWFTKGHEYKPGTLQCRGCELKRELRKHLYGN